jgi:YHS domain-containing protein
MIVTALALFTVGAFAHQETPAPTPITCAIMGGDAKAGGGAVEYKGVRYDFCCPSCVGAFQANPTHAIMSDKVKGKTIGTFLFDPVSGARITDAQGKATEDYNGVRYLFLSNDEKKTFDAEPAKYVAIPAKEALFCPVEKEKISSYMAAGSYRDYEGVRYYFCCSGCPEEFTKKPADYAKVAASYVRDPKPLAVKDVTTAAPANAAPADTFVAENFNCKHCGRPMSINSPDDSKMTCSVCGCGKTAAGCKPGK